MLTVTQMVHVLGSHLLTVCGPWFTFTVPAGNTTVPRVVGDFVPGHIKNQSTASATINSVRYRQFEGEVLYSRGKNSENWGDKFADYTSGDGNYVDNNSSGYIELVAPTGLCAATYKKSIDFSNYKYLYLVVNKKMDDLGIRTNIKNSYPYKINDASSNVASLNPSVVYDGSDLIVYKMSVESVTGSGYFSITGFNGSNNGLRIYEVYLEK